MAPKREKIAKKCTFIFEIVLYDRGNLQNYRIWCLAYDKQKEKCEERAKVEGKFLARTRVREKDDYRYFYNSNSTSLDIRAEALFLNLGWVGSIFKSFLKNDTLFYEK